VRQAGAASGKGMRTMFLEKLWLRIRGELLLLKEDLTGEGALRERAEDFLQKLERRLSADDVPDEARSDPLARLDAVKRKMEEARSKVRDREHTTEKTDRPSLDELERAWEELKKLREDKRRLSTEGNEPPPNPRKLG
jgi:DNA repair exonuclease SbcCD nuclease subunit